MFGVSIHKSPIKFNLKKIIWRFLNYSPNVLSCGNKPKNSLTPDLILTSSTVAQDDEVLVLLSGSHWGWLLCCCAKQFPFCSQCLSHKGGGWKCSVCRRLSGRRQFSQAAAEKQRAELRVSPAPFTSSSPEITHLKSRRSKSRCSTVQITDLTGARTSLLKGCQT